MASLTYDGQSLLLDGKRLWLVSGSFHYARITRDQWAARVHAAKVLGLNTLVIPVVWARHEGRTGQYDFTGENDLRHLVQLIQQAGMYAVLRLGPYVGCGYDLGGLPPWILGLKDVNLRTNSAPYLEASARFIGAVAKQVRDLQVVVPAELGDVPGGPIIMVQSEHQWLCGHEAIAHAYLGELHRYIRESGFEVPIINTNNLWEGVEGEIDGWVGQSQLLATMRQLSIIRPSQMRMVMEYPLGHQATWGEDASTSSHHQPTPDRVTRDLCEILAGGGQFNIEAVAAGGNFAFSGGRFDGGHSRFSTAAFATHAPIDATGQHTSLFEPIRRVAMFASRFGRVLSHLDHRKPIVSLAPLADAPDQSKPSASGKSAKTSKLNKSAQASGPAVVHASGSQGSVVFIFKNQDAQAGQSASLLLPDGTVLPMPLNAGPVTFGLLDVRLWGRSQLDYCNLTPLALVGKVFVIYGPPGAKGRLSINDSPIELDVPKNHNPAIFEHEGIMLVVASEEHLAKITITDDAVLVNAIDVTFAGNPVVQDANDVVTRIIASGEIIRSKFGEKAPTPPPPAPAAASFTTRPTEQLHAKGKKGSKAPSKKGSALPPPPPPPAPTAPPVIRPGVVVKEVVKLPKHPELSPWTSASMADYIDGSSARFAAINGPAELTTLGSAYGYGWYKLSMRSSASGKLRLAWPTAADRAHLFLDGKYQGVLGVGPGALDELSVSLKKSEQILTVLVENAGRFCEGAHMLDRKGLLGHAVSIADAKAISKVKLADGLPLAVLQHIAPLSQVHGGHITDSSRITWETPKRKSPLLMRINTQGYRGLIIINDAVVGHFDNAGPRVKLIDESKLARQSNTIQLALFQGDLESALSAFASSVTFSDVLAELTENAQWSFAKWERPSEAVFKPSKSTSHGKGPEWFRSTFMVPSTISSNLTMIFHAAGLTKGQLYINRKHVGRYFTATHQGQHVGPQIDLNIPLGALRTGEVNEVVVFDEHGHTPGRAKLLWK